MKTKKEELKEEIIKDFKESLEAEELKGITNKFIAPSIENSKKEERKGTHEN